MRIPCQFVDTILFGLHFFHLCFVAAAANAGCESHATACAGTEQAVDSDEEKTVEQGRKSD